MLGITIGSMQLHFSLLPLKFIFSSILYWKGKGGGGYLCYLYVILIAANVNFPIIILLLLFFISRYWFWCGYSGSGDTQG